MRFRQGATAGMIGGWKGEGDGGMVQSKLGGKKGEDGSALIRVVLV